MSVIEQGKSNRNVFLLAFFIAALILANGAFSYWQIGQVKEEFDDVAYRDLPLMTMLLPLIDQQHEETLLFEQLQKLEIEHKSLVINLLEERFKLKGKRFEKTLLDVKSYVESIQLDGRAEIKQEMRKILSLIEQIESDHKQYNNQVIIIIEEKKSSGHYLAEKFVEREGKLLSEQLIGLRNELQNFTIQSAKAVSKHEEWVIQGVVLFTLFAYSLGTLMLFIMRQVMTGREQAISEIVYHATYDPLTNLYNRRHFFQRLDDTLKLSKRYKQPMSLCICDLDYFKKINDTLGHQTGDNVLTTFAEIINEEKRDVDFAGRFGGDEFVLCLPNAHAKDIVNLLERIRKALETRVFKINQNENFSVTSSFGVAEIDFDNANQDRLLESADKALYLAKERGRNQVVTL